MFACHTHQVEPNKKKRSVLSNLIKEDNKYLLFLPIGLFILCFPSIHADEKRTIKIATVMGLLTCHQDEYGPFGLEYQLIHEFFDALKQPVQFKVYPNRQSAVQAVKSGEQDMVAAFLNPSQEQKQGLLATIPWHLSDLIFIQKMRDKPPIEKADQKLSFPIYLPENSLYKNKIQQINPDWPLKSLDLSEEDLLLGVNDGRISYSITRLAQFQAYRIMAPMLRKSSLFKKKVGIRWLFAPELSDLRDQANDFLAFKLHDGTLKKQIEKAQNGFKKDFVTRATFWKHVRKRLPRYIKYFQSAEKITGIDWRLLAAVAYQESHWNKNARSPTGVEGIMMLTQATAKQQGIQDRLDPKQSIIGGAKNLLWMEKRLPKSIQGEDILWFTLAAYNIGFGHILDARQLARWSKENDDSWSVVKKYLPLLSKKRFYQKLKYGKARGKEPVKYVDNIQYYYHLLVLWDHQRLGIDCSHGNNRTHLRLRKN